MKKYIATILLLFLSQYIFAQSEQNILRFYEFKKGDTLIQIKLLKKNKVILEHHPKQKIPDGFAYVNENGKAICKLGVGYYYSSYGNYKILNEEIIMTFKDENPIEKIITKPLEIENNSSKITTVKITTHQDLLYDDLVIYQGDEKLCFITVFSNQCQFEIKNENIPLRFEYFGYSKNYNLTSVIDDVEIEIIINNKKGNNYIKNKAVRYNIKNKTLN